VKFRANKRFLDESQGLPVGSVWDDINPINSQAKEALGYPTQKPLPLLERIIQTSSNENDIVLDAFAGAYALWPRRPSEDNGSASTSRPRLPVMAKRLRDVCGIAEDEALWKVGRGFVVRDLPWTEEKLRVLPPFEFENWAVIALGGIPNKTQVGDQGIDGRIYPLSAVAEAHAQYGRDGGTGADRQLVSIQVSRRSMWAAPISDAFETACAGPSRRRVSSSPSATPRTPCARLIVSSSRTTRLSCRDGAGDSGRTDCRKLA